MSLPEMVVLIDKTGSFSQPIKVGADTSRKDVAKVALETFVGRLGELDPKGAKEKKGGGILGYAFSFTGPNDDNYQELDDINVNNFDEVWQGIDWGGGTVIMPCWNAMISAYNEEFKDDDPKPNLLVIGLSDGALDPEDAKKFQTMLRHLEPHITFELVLIGEGRDTRGSYEAYKSIADASHGRFIVRSLQGSVDPQAISDELFAIAAAQAN